jgi:polyketide cyclase/dehydrase/lipid transport protein
MTAARRQLTGRIRVALPPAEAFRLFTPRGEQDWAHGWHPQFPAPAQDDTEPGTVFETSAHGQHTVWVVTDRQPGARISYARVTPGDLAGTVTVAITAAGQHCEVEVTYHVTALASAASERLREFADGYPAYLRSWQDAIAAWLDRPLSGYQLPGHDASATASASDRSSPSRNPAAIAESSDCSNRLR